jgi:serine protease Do
MRRLLVVTALTFMLTGCRQPASSQQFSTEDHPPQRVDRVAPAEDIASSRRTAITRAVEVATPAVVSINVLEVQQVRYRDPFAGDPFFEHFFGRRGDRVIEREVQNLGSGFVISPDGFIVTNDHVAGNATRITVAFPDGQRLEARLVGSDPETDIALLKVDPAQPLAYLSFGQDDVFVGEWAIALGNPFGLFEAAEPSVTVGVVSATGRDFPAQEGRIFRDMIQTDAAINRGNSGGPLVNAMGEVIGVNTFIYTQTGGSVGLGFATPSWRVRRVVEELQRTGRVDRAIYTGLNIRRLAPRVAELLNLGVQEGLLVESVDPGSPAARAGIQQYDVITMINGARVRNPADAAARLVDNRPGDTITMTLIRQTRELQAQLTLARSQR